MLSASRGAFVATVIGALILFLTHTVDISKNVKKLMLFSLLLFCTYTLWNHSLGRLNEKNARYEDYGVYDSRTSKFEFRLNEISQTPIFGQGFAAIDTRTGDAFNPKQE